MHTNPFGGCIFRDAWIVGFHQARERRCTSGVLMIALAVNSNSHVFIKDLFQFNLLTKRISSN